MFALRANLTIKHTKECKKMGIDATIDFEKNDAFKKPGVLKIENQIKNLDLKISDHYVRGYKSQIERLNNFVHKFTDIQIDCTSNVNKT